MDKFTNKNTQINNINPVISTPSDEKNIFKKQSVGNFWDFFSSSVNTNSVEDDVQHQINNLKAEVEKFKSFLVQPEGNILNLLG